MCASINKWKFFLAQLQDVKIPELKHLELLSRDGLYRPFFTALSQYLSYSHEVAERLVRPIKGIKFDQANSSWSKRDVQGLNSIRSTYLEKIISRSFSEDDLNSGEIEADNISAQAVSKQTTPEVNSLPALTLTTIALFLSDSYNHKGKAKSIFNHVKLYTRDTLTTALNELDYLEAFNTKKINHTFIFDQNLTNVDYLLRLARILRNLDKYPDVVKLYPQVIPFYRKIISDETDPDTLQNLLAILCEMALMCGDLTIAEEACDKLLNIGKNVQEALEIQNLRFAVKVQCQKLDEAQKMLDLYGSHGLDPALIFLFYVYSRKFEEALKYITNINPLNIRTSHFCRPYRNSDLLFAILNFYQGNFHFCPVKILDSEIATTLDLCAKMHLNQLNNVNPENILNPQLRADIFYHSALANYNKGDTPTAKCQLEKAMTLYKESYNNDNFKPYEKSKSLLESWNNVLTLKLPH
jgi:tetratricopeptide (TPR) repeat protein